MRFCCEFLIRIEYIHDNKWFYLQDSIQLAIYVHNLSISFHKFHLRVPCKYVFSVRKYVNISFSVRCSSHCECEYM